MRTATISFAMSVRPSAWNNSAPTGWVFMKFKIRGFFENLSKKKIQVSLKSNKNKEYFTLRPIHIYFFDHISHISSYNEKCFRHKFAEKIKTHILCSVFFFFFFSRKSYRLWQNVEKYRRAGKKTNDNMAYAHCMLGA